VKVQTNGQISIYHKASRTQYTGLNALENVGDSGDEYQFRKSGSPSKMSETETNVGTVHHYSTHSIVEVNSRIGSSNGIPVRIIYLLTKNSRRLEIRIEFSNQLNNHRVATSFTCPFPVTYHSDSQFEIINRGRLAHGFYPQMKFLTMYDEANARGLTVANRGLPEWQPHEKGATVTLLRSTDRIGDWGKFPNPSAQAHGDHAFELALIPFGGEPQAHSLFSTPLHGSDLQARAFNERMLGMHCQDYPGFIPETLVDMSLSELSAFGNPSALRGFPQNSLDDQDDLVRNVDEGRPFTSLIDLRPYRLVLSTVKKSETTDGLIVRFYNPYDTQVDAEILLSPLLAVKEAFLCNLNEERQSRIELTTANAIAMKVPYKKVITLELV